MEPVSILISLIALIQGTQKAMKESRKGIEWIRAIRHVKKDSK